MKTNRLYKVISAIAFMLMLNQFSALGQPYWLTGLSTPTGAYPNLLGTSGATLAPYQDIFFQTLATQQMVLKTSGNLGVGLNYTLPTQLVSILGGNYNIDASTPTYGYMIADQLVLWHNGITSNIFVGVGAGNNSGIGVSNTFWGANAGLSFYSGSYNTVGGVGAGEQLIYGSYNTLVS